jgi:hypothetical protein
VTAALLLLLWLIGPNCTVATFSGFLLGSSSSGGKKTHIGQFCKTVKARFHWISEEATNHTPRVFIYHVFRGGKPKKPKKSLKML